MPFVSRRITAPQGKDDQFEIAGLKWLGFTEPYSYENQYKPQYPLRLETTRSEPSVEKQCSITRLTGPW